MKKIHSPWMTVVVWFALMIIFTCAAVFVYTVAFADPSTTFALKWLQFMQSLAMFLLPALCVAFLHTDNAFSWLHLDKSMSWRTALFAVVIMLCAIPAINLLSHINQQMVLPSFLHSLEDFMRTQEDAANRLIEQFMQDDTVWGLLINLGLMALLPALCEEITFRGMLQSLLTPADQDSSSLPRLAPRQHLVIWLVAAIFSFVHFQFYGFVPRMLMGAMFGYMVAWTGSLWVPMLMHFVNNGATVLSYFYMHTHHLDPDSLDSIGISSTLWLGILSLFVVPVALYLFQRYRRCFTKNAICQ